MLFDDDMMDPVDEEPGEDLDDEDMDEEPGDDLDDEDEDMGNDDDDI